MDRSSWSFPCPLPSLCLETRPFCPWQVFTTWKVGKGTDPVVFPVSLGPSAPTADSQHGIQATARRYPNAIRNQEALVAALSLASVGICLGFGSSDVNHSHDELGLHSSGQCRLASAPSRKGTVLLLCWAVLGGGGGLLGEEDSGAETLESCWDDCCAGPVGAEPGSSVSQAAFAA